MTKQYLLGLDVGSSSVKASLIDAASGRLEASAFFPEREAPILAPGPGYAEQDPEMWWHNAKLGIAKTMTLAGAKAEEIKAIGISYQMHGLVCVDKDLKPLRPSIIWCDSRAVAYGEKAFSDLGADTCLSHMLGSPGNFTASKLAWVKENEPDLFDKIYKIMLPGDYIALKLSGEATTTVGGLSEGILWDFKEDAICRLLLDYYGFNEQMLCPIVPTFGIQGRLTTEAARETGLEPGTPITYRAGDQPNNALSLGVFEPGEIASTGGTSGVVYGVLGEINYDPKSRVNTFAHVNHSKEEPRLGVLLCINGCGILNAWVKRTLMPVGLSYQDMNLLGATAPIGSEGLSVVPFGNGAERVIENRAVGCTLAGIDFNRHQRSHIVRAAQEGIAFSFCYGMEVMREMGMDISNIHAGKANLFLSDIFRETLATVSGATIDLYATDGSMGAARAAGIGIGIYADHHEALDTLQRLGTTEPDTQRAAAYKEAYQRWKQLLARSI